MVFYGILVSLLLIACVTDIRSQRIPNWLTCSSVVAAMVYHGGAEGLPGLMPGIEGLALGIAFLLPFYMAGGMGAGDVKLMAAVSAWAGIHNALLVLIATAIAGGFLAVYYIVFYRRLSRSMQNMGELLRFHFTSGIQPHPELNLQDPASLEVPYGVAIAVGTFYLLISTVAFRG